MGTLHLQLGITQAHGKFVGELRRKDGERIRTLVADSEPELVERARDLAVAMETRLPAGAEDVPDQATAERYHERLTQACRGLLSAAPANKQDGFLLCAQVTALNAYRRWLRIRIEGMQVGLEESTEDEDEALRDALVLQGCLESCRAEGAAAPEIQPIARA